METATDNSVLKDSCTPLPLSVLRLMVPPVRLMSAAVWQTIQRKVVSDYGMIEEFVSTVTDILPDLLSTEHKAQLILGLRAQVTLDLCQLETTANMEFVEPHLDRMQTLIEAWNTEVATADTEASHSEFVDLVRNLLKNPEEREHFFKNVFPEEFGPIYQKDLCTLMWIFLSRLENCLPLQSFQQVAPMLGEAPSFLEDFVDAVLRREEFNLLLQNQKDHSGVDHDGKPLLIIPLHIFPSVLFFIALTESRLYLQPGTGNISGFTTARLQLILHVN
ncbi:uncharacterized protein LOC142893273 [Nelusetta ayraudi]|uniref:uncharacterized protein LOC142893273 n=1 Tax=Nelusetta ayraudi TaxID=303726 RepID=UPI003F6FBA9E